MFSVAGLTAMAIVAGCQSTVPFKDADGNELTTATGGKVMVVEIPSNPQETALPDDAPMKDRLEAAERNKGKTIEISYEDAERARELLPRVEKNIVAALKGTNSDFSRLTQLVEFVDGNPNLTRAAITRAAGPQVSPGVAVALCALLRNTVERTLTDSVYPNVVDATLKKLTPVVDQAVADGRYAYARNAIWAASTRGVPAIDCKIREKSIEMMHRKVNPANWDSIASKMKAVFDKAMGEKTYEAGIEQIRKIETESIQQEYSVFIDKRLAAVRDELIKIGVTEGDMKPILDKQAAIISEAAKILDVMDGIDTIEAAKSETREVSPREDPKLKDYYAKLDEFHAVLLRYDCVKPTADGIVVKLDDDLLALINMLRKPAKNETIKSDAKTALLLGTRSLNGRIHAAANGYVAQLTGCIQDAAKSDLSEKVKELVAAGQFEEARELIWNASVTGDAKWDAEMFAYGIALLRDIVNPADWARIEAEITATFTKLSAEGQFDELEAYLKGYPLIRQHTVKLDEQLARVRAEAEALGADPDKAANAALIACGMVTEAQALVDHFDELVATAAAEGKTVDESKLQAELVEYARRLAAYHATPENVAKIVERLRTSLKELILVAPDNARPTRLSLGTNAVNDRIKALVDKLLASIQATKNSWQDDFCATLMTNLEQRVRAAVKEQKFGEARDMIRDTELIGRSDLDLKLYALRIGLLDSCVNPAQLDYLLADIDAKVQKFVEAEDYEAFEQFLTNYPYVHDEYAKIDAALELVRKAMLGLEIPAAECKNDEKVRFADAISELLERRDENWKPKRDLKPLESALDEVAKAIFEHMNKHPEAIAAERAAEYEHILSDVAALDRTITTWELNERLRARLAKETPVVAAGLQMLKERADRKAFLAELAAIDAEVSFDAQIAMAEEAISRQLGMKCKRASYKINAVLGEYARAFRLLKKNVELKPAEATSILLGAVYLEQAAVVPYALKLGADVNGTSARDPRRRTALMLAIDVQNMSLMRTLVEAGASSAATDADGNSLLHYAVKSGSIIAVKAIAGTASLEVTNNAGETPLFEAVRRNQTVMVQTVIGLIPTDRREAFVNAADKSGLTAIALAAKLGSRDVLDPLADAGARFSERELILAEEGDHLAVAQWLVAQGADVNAAGVMAKACPATATGRYLIGQGGVCEHACDVCKPEPDPVKAPAADPAAKPEKKLEAAGTITFKIDGAELK